MADSETMGNTVTGISEVSHKVVQQFINSGAESSTAKSSLMFGALIACGGYAFYQLGSRYFNDNDTTESTDSDEED